jgi:moderate conductance mechanosensitive channel
MLLWVCWVIRAMTSFRLILVIVTLPLAISTRRAVENVLRPPGSTQAEGGAASVVGACVDRGIRGLLIIGAWGWGIDLEHLRNQETWFGRVADGVLTAIVILLVVDVLWHATKAAIDRKLAEAGDPGLLNTEEGRKRARMRTLLPISRNIFFVVVIAVAVLMALSAMGVQIARCRRREGSSALRSVLARKPSPATSSPACST